MNTGESDRFWAVLSRRDPLEIERNIIEGRYNPQKEKIARAYLDKLEKRAKFTSEGRKETREIEVAQATLDQRDYTRKAYRQSWVAIAVAIAAVAVSFIF